MCSLAVTSLRKEEKKKNQQNTGHFFPLRTFVSEIISSSQPPITSQPKTVPSFLSSAHPPPSSLPKQEHTLANHSTGLKFHGLCITSGLLGETLKSQDHGTSPELEDHWQGLQAETAP